MGRSFSRETCPPRLGLSHGQFAIAIDQHVIGGERLAPFTLALDPVRRDRIFTVNFAPLHHTPTRRLQRGVNVLSSGFGFVYGCLSE